MNHPISESRIRFDESRERWYLALFSPTWMFAARMKRHTMPEQRSKTIELFNLTYLLISVCSVCLEAAFPFAHSVPLWYTLTWAYFLFSRCTDVFAAFLVDAKDHLNRVAARSTLPYGTRLSLALRSYLELVLIFALLYHLTPISWWRLGDGSSSLLDFSYFSGITITTTGYGDIVPLHEIPRLLVIYEVFCGVLLLVVCFTIYTSRALSRDVSREPTEPAETAG